MRVDIRDPDAMKVLPPLEVASYLRAFHWRQAELKEGEYAVWTLNDDVEAFLPLRTDTRDYALRMGDLLRVLSTVEGRSQSDLLADLLTTNADVVRIRLIDDDLADGSMPIEEYTRASQKARDLLLAAACSAIFPRPVWPNRKPDQAVNYLRGVRMGQSERGSYVLKIISRVAPKLASGQAGLFAAGDGADPDGELPYERAVVNTLAIGLREAESAASAAASSGTVDRFEKAVAVGVSANFCEALVGLAQDRYSKRRVDVTFAWSRSRPNRPDVASRVVVSQDRVPFFKEAARVLRDRSPVDDFELVGAVVKLERAENALAGQVTLHAATDSGMRRVRVELHGADYQLALQAHGSDLDLRITGRLVRDGRLFALQNPRGLAIATAVALDE